MSKQIQEAYIVAATRTPVGKAPKGMFRNTRPDDMLAHVLKAVVAQNRRQLFLDLNPALLRVSSHVEVLIYRLLKVT